MTAHQAKLTLDDLEDRIKKAFKAGCKKAEECFDEANELIDQYQTVADDINHEFNTDIEFPEPIDSGDIEPCFNHEDELEGLDEEEED